MVGIRTGRLGVTARWRVFVVFGPVANLMFFMHPNMGPILLTAVLKVIRHRVSLKALP
jgi:hypothetical protein